FCLACGFFGLKSHLGMTAVTERFALRMTQRQRKRGPTDLLGIRYLGDQIISRRLKLRTDRFLGLSRLRPPCSSLRPNWDLVKHRTACEALQRQNAKKLRDYRGDIS